MLSRLSIKQKLILIMMIPLMVVILLAAKLAVDSFSTSRNMKSLDDVVVLSTKIGALVHETQKERGMTAGFLGSKGENKIDDEEEHVKIYCDGACSGNPGNAGSGLAIYSNEKKPVLLFGAYEEVGTNNIAELNALHQALIIASQTFSENIISIYSDSKYAIDCITTWAYGWKANKSTGFFSFE